MKQIVQCVPNFSEGKDIHIINQIIEPLKNKEGFLFVSAEPDKDYNRTVVTILGDPNKMIEPLVEFFAKAQQLIDMRKHSGEHPRMGAIDVVPFIPISGITMNECIDYANKLAKEVNERLNIPIFLYAEAATKSYKRSLPNIRKGEFEGMHEKIKEPKWHPDYGKDEIHTSFGTTAIGARMPLLAYNIDLDTTDESVANRIARTIRKSSGGFAYVQAGPATLEERGHTQVTMNILDYKKNPLYRIFETVKMEAKRYSIDVKSSEVVGLIPKDALLRSIKYYKAVNNTKINDDISLDELSHLAIKYFGLREFSKDKIVESYLEDK